jgi:hypothetical protein
MIILVTFRPSENPPQNVEQNSHDEHKHKHLFLLHQDCGAPNLPG